MIIAVLKKLLSLPDTVANYLQLRYFKVKYERDLSINGKLVIGGLGTISMARGVKINSSVRSNPVGGGSRTALFCAKGAKLEIGRNVGISNATVYAHQQIVIKEDVLLGGGCQIYDTDFHSISYEDRVQLGDHQVNTAPVLIEQGAFIGANAVILKGVTIGKRSIVAAGAVVAKDVPEDQIWGGNPAIFIKALK